MTSIPTPIAVAMMLALLAATNHHQLNQTATGKTFLLALYTYAFSMVFIGLRWSLDSLIYLRCAASLAVASTVLLYLAFRSLGQQPIFSLRDDWRHLIPIATMLSVALFKPNLTDIALVLIKLLYAGLLIRQARMAPASLQLTHLDWLKNSQRALWGAAILLLISVIIDVAITIDFIFNQGQHAASLVGWVNLIAVLLIGWAAVQAARGFVDSDQRETEAVVTSSKPTETDTDDIGDEEMLVKLNKLLIDNKLYTDCNLNLQKIARKAGIPSRVISRTINARTGQNVSQWVNSARIDAVCTLLKTTDLTISESLMNAGFSTKSNFNREFKRATGLSPSAWRAREKVDGSKNAL